MITKYQHENFVVKNRVGFILRLFSNVNVGFLVRYLLYIYQQRLVTPGQAPKLQAPATINKILMIIIK